MSKSLEALNELCDLATSNGDCLNYVIGLSMTIKQDLDLLNDLIIEVFQVKKGKIVIEIYEKTNFETYTKIKEVLENGK